MPSLQPPAEILAPSPLPECRPKAITNIVSIPLSPLSSGSGQSDEENTKNDDDDFPLVLLTFALHIDAPSETEEEEDKTCSVLFPCSCSLEDNSSTEIPDSKQPRADGSPRPQRPNASNKKPVRNVSAPPVLPSRERRKPFAECGNLVQRDHEFRMDVSKLKLKTRRSYGGDEKENIPPLRRVSLSLDV
ncbi:hypothetical protein MSAN_01033100 [Mycena sanguinolenta]|uniref:Uncharacterized protein n=1 Tax=Mycena sanguinolenta TaxID=230812 RepID=A0A8H6YM93_9AGAR|nr:hypothetical protein MSAN_01033100 [Mycena sanguinolenta]